MITSAVGNWFLHGAANVIGFVPPLSPGVIDGFNGFDGKLASLIDYVSKFAPVVPFQAIGAAGALVLGCWLAALGIQAGRITLSIFSLGGGGV